jgi:hypothetical protein
MIIKKGDKLLCTKDINNVFGLPLFKKDDTYTVLDVDNESVTLDHILYANEYMEYKLEILKNFIKYDKKQS